MNVYENVQRKTYINLPTHEATVYEKNDNARGHNGQITLDFA